LHQHLNSRREKNEDVNFNWSLLGADEPNLQALQSVLANVRENTARLQTELHAVILKFYTTTRQW
jgi:hypothetical protein